jgi:hypothetical protein
MKENNLEKKEKMNDWDWWWMKAWDDPNSSIQNFDH